MKKPTSKEPTWVDLKRQLVDYNRAALLSLVQDLYAASKENQTFLHARFDLGADAIAPYKATIKRWVCPEVMRNEEISITKAKKAISDYKKAIGKPEGLVELAVYYCECCVRLTAFFALDDVTYLGALLRMYEEALKGISKLEPSQQGAFVERLVEVQEYSGNPYWDLYDDMFVLLFSYGFIEEDEWEDDV